MKNSIRLLNGAIPPPLARLSHFWVCLWPPLMYRGCGSEDQPAVSHVSIHPQVQAQTGPRVLKQMVTTPMEKKKKIK